MLSLKYYPQTDAMLSLSNKYGCFYSKLTQGTFPMRNLCHPHSELFDTCAWQCDAENMVFRQFILFACGTVFTFGSRDKAIGSLGRNFVAVFSDL